MKNLYFLLLIGLFASCSNDTELTEEVTAIEFVGVYTGNFECTGDLMEANTELMEIEVIKNTDANYTIDLGDDVRFEAIANENVLSIAEQVFNEGGDFDVVTFSGKITYQLETEEYMFTFTHDVDNEGISNCTFPITKN